MKSIAFILAIVMAFSLMTIINAGEVKHRPMNLFRERLLDLLLEAKRRELLFNKYHESEEDFQRREYIPFNQESDEDDDDARIYQRRKVVGISDNPF